MSVKNGIQWFVNLGHIYKFVIQKHCILSSDEVELARQIIKPLYAVYSYNGVKERPPCYLTWLHLSFASSFALPFLSLLVKKSLFSGCFYPYNENTETRVTQENRVIFLQDCMQFCEGHISVVCRTTFSSNTLKCFTLFWFTILYKLFQFSRFCRFSFITVVFRSWHSILIRMKSGIGCSNDCK